MEFNLPIHCKINTMTISNDNIITINLNELVEIRTKVLDISTAYADVKLDDDGIDEVAAHLRSTLTWDTLYGMVDQAILEHVDQWETHYGEIQPEPGREALLTEMEKNRKQFEMVDLVAPSWTIKVPRRK